MGIVIKKEGEQRFIVNEDTGESMIYVHRNIDNFNTEIAKKYFKDKQKNKEQMLERYSSRLIESIQLTDQQKTLLNITTPEGLDKLFGSVDSGITKGLNDAFSKIKDISSDLNRLSNEARKSYSENGIKNIKEIIELINKAVELVQGKGNALSILLNNYLNDKIGLQNLSAELSQALSLQDDNGKIIGMSSQALNTVAKSLNNLIIQSNQKTLSREQVNGYFNNIFSTGLGESLIATGVARQLMKGTDQIVDKLLTGTDVPIKETKDYSEYYRPLINQTYKPDVSTGSDYVQIQINDKGDSIGIQLGLSVKQYSSISDHVSIVTGKPFRQILNALFSDGKYHAYNTLGLLDDTRDLYREMKKLIILSYADNFLSGTGSGTDFTQFIVINGQAYPIYVILKSIIENTKGQITGDQDITDPVVISIQGASKLKHIRKKYLQTRNNIRGAWNRNKEIKNIINNLEVMGKFYPQAVFKV